MRPLRTGTLLEKGVATRIAKEGNREEQRGKLINDSCVMGGIMRQIRSTDPKVLLALKGEREW